MKDEAGATAIEYALIATLISIIAVAGLSQIGGLLSTFFASVLAGFH